MHVVLVNVTIHNSEPARERLKNEIVPNVSQAPGFVAGYWYGDESKGAATIVFESEENANKMVEMLRAQPGTGDASVDDVQVREVVANA